MLGAVNNPLCAAILSLTSVEARQPLTCYCPEAFPGNMKRATFERAQAFANLEVKCLQRIAQVARIGHRIGELIGMLIAGVADDERDTGLGERGAKAEQNGRDEEDASTAFLKIESY